MCRELVARRELPRDAADAVPLEVVVERRAVLVELHRPRIRVTRVLVEPHAGNRSLACGLAIGQIEPEFVADVLNKTLYQLVTRCRRAEGVRNYFDVGVLAYGGNGVESGFRGALSASIVHPLAEIESNISGASGIKGFAGHLDHWHRRLR